MAESKKNKAVTDVIEARAFITMTIDQEGISVHVDGKRKDLKYLIGKAWNDNEKFQQLIGESIYERQQFEATKYKLN